MVPLNSETLCPSEATVFINEKSVRIPSQFLISKIPASFDENFEQLNTNSRIEVTKFGPEPTF